MCQFDADAEALRASLRAADNPALAAYLERMRNPPCAGAFAPPSRSPPPADASPDVEEAVMAFFTAGAAFLASLTRLVAAVAAHAPSTPDDPTAKEHPPT